MAGCTECQVDDPRQPRRPCRHQYGGQPWQTDVDRPGGVDPGQPTSTEAEHPALKPECQAASASGWRAFVFRRVDLTCDNLTDHIGLPSLEQLPSMLTRPDRTNQRTLACTQPRHSAGAGQGFAFSTLSKQRCAQVALSCVGQHDDDELSRALRPASHRDCRVGRGAGADAHQQALLPG